MAEGDALVREVAGDPVQRVDHCAAFVRDVKTPAGGADAGPIAKLFGG